MRIIAREWLQVLNTCSTYTNYTVGKLYNYGSVCKNMRTEVPYDTNIGQI